MADYIHTHPYVGCTRSPFHPLLHPRICGCAGSLSLTAAYCHQVSIVEELLPDSFYSDNMNSLLAELDLFDELLR